MTDIKFRLGRSSAMHNFVVRKAIDILHLAVNLFLVLLNRPTRIVGLRRFSLELQWLLSKHKQAVTVYKNYVTVSGKRIHKLNSVLAAFLPIEKVVFPPAPIEELRNQLERLFTPRDPKVFTKFYRAYWFYVTTFTICLAINIVMFIMFVIYSITFFTEEQIATIVWLIANSYLTLQLLIFHKTRLRFVAMAGMLSEASAGEEDEALFGGASPKAIILVPAYKEEPELLRRSILCHALQKLPKKKIVLLLGNEFYTDDASLREKTDLVHGNLNDLAAQLRGYHQSLLDVRQYGFAEKKLAMRNIVTDFSLLVSRWSDDIRQSPVKYPTDAFIISEVMLPMHGFFSGIAERIGESDAAQLKAVLLYLLDFFDVKLEIFMRMKYGNTEHEKTKAGNLTSYLKLINNGYSEEYDAQTDSWRVKIGAPTNEFEYVGIFDCDTICKPEYLLRKICFLSRPGTEEIGLIQSPYVVPVPEPSVTSVSSGIQSFWFLPISIGLSSYNSSFWLGFNSCWRYSALTTIPSFLSETVIEDVEVSLQLLQRNYKIVTSPERNCITYSPKDLRGIQIQRSRWASGGLRILYCFIRDCIKGKYQLSNPTEFILRANYVINLNLLPVFTTLQFLVHTPLHYQFVGLIVVNYVSYLVLYFRITSQYSRYSFRELFDGMIIGILMNFHYLRGLKSSVVSLFKPRKNLVFISTPRQADLVKKVGEKIVLHRGPSSVAQIGLFEIAGLLFTFYVYAKAFFFNCYIGYYYDIFPIFQMLCIIYLLHRFIGFKSFLKGFLTELWRLFAKLGHLRLIKAQGK